jgi:hypothetical protein
VVSGPSEDDEDLPPTLREQGVTAFEVRRTPSATPFVVS